MDIKGRTQPSYRPRGSEEADSVPAPVIQPSGSVDGISVPGSASSTPPQPQQPQAPQPQASQNVIGGGTVPQSHPNDEAALERIMQDVRQDPRLAPDQPNETPAEAGKQQVPAAPKKHSRMPFFVAIAALLIAGALAVTAYFAFSGNRAEENGNKIINQVSSPTDTQEATPESVNQTSEEIGQDIDSLQDSQDFNEADLGDQQLGL